MPLNLFSDLLSPKVCLDVNTFEEGAKDLLDEVKRSIRFQGYFVKKIIPKGKGRYKIYTIREAENA